MDSSLVLSYNSPHSLLKSQGRKVTAPYESLSSEHCAECDLRALPPCSCCHSAARRLYSNISLLGRESESQGAACCGFTSREEQINGSPTNYGRREKRKTTEEGKDL